jgi:DNA polymerase-3 subunit alpha
MDGVATPQEYCERANEIGMTAIAITDHGSLAGHREFYRVAKEHGLKPILGIEAYFTTDRFDRRDRKDRTEPLDLIYNHIVLLAKNDNGLKNLNRLSELAWTEGYFHKPRMDWELLDQYGDDLMVGSGCMSGPINKAIEVGDLNVAKAWVTKFKDRFGDNFYIEVMPHNPTFVNEALVELSVSMGVMLVATPDCHHATSDHKEIQEMMLLLNTHADVIKGHTYSASCKCDTMMERFDYLYGEDRRMSFRSFNIHLLSEEEMYRDLQANGLTAAQALESMVNTWFVVDRIEDYTLPEHLDVLPVEYADPDKQLRGYAIKGLKDRGLTTQEYRDRLDEELSIIKGMGFSPYFLMVRNITNYAHQKSIRMSPGRGSAAGSLVAYALGITNVDPIEHNLLFFRFIDPSRPDWPDIDMDFQDDRREEIKEMIARRYGHVASIATFNGFKDKSTVRDISRVLRIPLDRVNAVLKHINTWDDFEHSTFPIVQDFRNEFPEVVTYGNQLMGRIRGTGIHAAGVVASKVPLADIVPLETRAPKKGAADDSRVLVVAVDKDEAERIGLIKMDILGLKTLTVIDTCVKLIKERHGIDIDLDELDYADPQVYDMLNRGLTKGVFQCEAGPYTNLIMDMGVWSLDELAASNALVRPGAANTIGKDYIDRKKGFRPTNYPHKTMKPFLENTYGCVLYQEQVMQACVVLGGMSMSEANQVRKIIGKKKDASEFDVFKDKFVANAGKLIGIPKAERMWHDFEAHAGYSFNLSHAVAYSMLSYQTAWLKYHYTLEFFLALFMNEEESADVTNYLIEAKRMGVTVKFPHINYSDLNWKIDGDGLRFGLKNIKYISDLSGQRFIERRPFESYLELENFVFTKGSGVNTKALDAMSKIGAANFEDHVVDRDEIMSNAYEFLGVPAFNFVPPEHWFAKMKNASEYNEGDTAIIFGFIRSVKTGPGWQLYEAMDSTGTFSFFGRENFSVEVGKAYLFVIAEKSVLQAIDVDKLTGDSALERYLDGATDNGYVVAAVSRKTKAGRKMGTVVIDIDAELVPAVLFPDDFSKIASRIKAGECYDFDLKPNRNGGMVLSGIR